MLLVILLSLVTLVAVFFLIASFQSAAFVVSRSATLPAPAAVVFEHVHDFHRWQEWSPWAKMDPDAKISYSGAEAGPGAGYAWEGRKTGQGSMLLLESRAAELIRIQLEFLRPFKASNLVEFTFQPQGGQTLVTWTMTGTRNLMMKAFGMVVDCDKMCGKDFEKGLASLSAVTSREAGVLA